MPQAVERLFEQGTRNLKLGHGRHGARFEQLPVALKLITHTAVAEHVDGVGGAAAAYRAVTAIDDAFTCHGVFFLGVAGLYL